MALSYRGGLAERFLKRASNSFVCELFDALPDVQYFVKDSRGRYIQVNQTLKNNYLMTSDSDIIGKTDHDVFPQYLAANYVDDDLQVLRGKPIRNRLELVGRYDGTASWSLTTKIPLASHNREIIGLAGITRDVGRPSKTILQNQDLFSVTQYVEENFARDITVEKMAQFAGISARSLQRKFRTTFRVSPTQYLRRVRINKAANLLVTTNLTVGEIAAQTGFADPSHLSREFRQAIGSAPTQFRRRYYHG